MSKPSWKSLSASLSWPSSRNWVPRPVRASCRSWGSTSPSGIPTCSISASALPGRERDICHAVSIPKRRGKGNPNPLFGSAPLPPIWKASLLSWVAGLRAGKRCACSKQPSIATEGSRWTPCELILGWQIKRKWGPPEGLTHPHSGKEQVLPLWGFEETWVKGVSSKPQTNPA